MTYVIYRTNAGTSTARPVVATDPGTAADAALQTLDANTAWVETPSFVPDMDVADTTLRRTYTVNPATGVVTASTTAAWPSAILAAILEQRKERLRQPALLALSTGAKTGESKATEWLTYLAAVEALTAADADPTAPAAGGADTLTIWQRMFRRGNLFDTPALAAGVPTGGVMAYASPAAGQHVWRRADREMIQTRTVASGTVTSGSSAVDGLFQTTDVLYPYPDAIPPEGAALAAYGAPAANFQNGLILSVAAAATGWNVRWARLASFSGGVTAPAFTLTLLARWA